MILALEGLAYAILFWIVGWRYPKVPLMLIFAAAPFQNDLSGGGPLKFSLSEVNLLLTLPLFLAKGRPIRYRPMMFPIGLYLLVCLLSSVLNWRGTTLISIVQTMLYYVVAVLVFAGFAKSERDYLPAFNGLLIVGILLATVGIATQWEYWYRFGLNKNGIGASLACATIVCAEMIFSTKGRTLRLAYGVAMAVIVAGLIFCVSRGAWLCAGTGLLVILGLRRRFVLIIRAVIIVIPVLLVCWRFMPAEAREYATDLSSDRYNIKLRYVSKDFAEALWKRSPLLGMAVGLRKEYDATNLTWLTLAETGIAGLSTLVLIHVVFLGMVWKTQRYLKRSSQLYSLLAMGAAQMVGRLAHGQVDHYWSRGAIMIACASMGMAIHARYATRRQVALARAQARVDEEEDSNTLPALISHAA